MPMSKFEIVACLFLIFLSFILLELRSTRIAEKRIEVRKREEVKRIKNMLKKSLGWGYKECRTEARKVMDALHTDLEFIEDQTRELEYGWLFRFGIPTEEANRSWDYLIGCSNELFVNRHTGKVEPLTLDESPMDLMGDKSP